MRRESVGHEVELSVWRDEGDSPVVLESCQSYAPFFSRKGDDRRESVRIRAGRADSRVGVVDCEQSVVKRGISQSVANTKIVNHGNATDFCFYNNNNDNDNKSETRTTTSITTSIPTTYNCTGHIYIENNSCGQGWTWTEQSKSSLEDSRANPDGNGA